ncbi:hypothetical protein ACMZ7J_03115 [Gardnerella greenwoodii]|uniref:hypothetical protein n=1 Tax=Gardnerella greenwoodii TaxID=2914925 RepID=UPI0039F11BCE
MTRQGMFNSKRGSITSFNSIENTVLMELALSSADYPLDAEAKKKKLMPRTYMHGWRELSKSLGMTISDSLENLSVISHEPRDLRKEETARIRIGRVMKKLQDKGLVKCLKTGRYSKRSSAVWLLTIGDEDENRECEKYVRYALNLDGKPPDAQPQPNNGMPKHTARTVTPTTPTPPTGNSTPNEALLALFKTQTKTMQEAIEHDKIEEQTTPIQEETEEEMYDKQVCEEIEEFKRAHDGLTPRQYFVKYGHNAPDIPTKPQAETHDAWYNKD